jgi:hypothetical protein
MSRQRLGKHISKVTEEHNNATAGRGESLLAAEFPEMEVAQFKECVTCTATLDRDEAVTTLRILPSQSICLHCIV